MRNTKFFLSLILSAFSFCGFAQNANNRNNVIDEVIWIVGDEAILKSDVEEARRDAMYMGQKISGDPYCVIPEQLAVQKLFLNQAAIDSVEVADGDVYQEVNRRIDAFIQEYGSKEKVEEYANKSITQLREQLFNSIKDEEMMNEVRRSLVKDIKVTPAQVRRYFKDLPEDSIPFVPTTVEVQIIVRSPKISLEEIERVKADLRDYTERVNSGTSKFSTLAVMYSQDPGSARRGGELGFTGKGMLVPEFANVAFNLNDTKTVSKIVESEFGYHIIQLIEKRGDMINVRHILRKPRVSDEALTDAINELDSLANTIRKGTLTFEQCPAEISDDKDTRNNYGNMVNLSQEASQSCYGTPKFELKDLPTEVAKVVSNMNIGEVSQPFVMMNSKSQEVVAIVKLKNKINGHRATMTDDYQVLQNVMVNKLSSDKIEEWITNKMKNTYIHINDDWKNCEFKYAGWIK